MHYILFVVTRNKSISVKTLHTLLVVNRGLGENNTCEMIFVDDNAYARQEALLKKIKHCDRVVWFDYSVHIDNESLVKLFGKFVNGYQCLVLPSVIDKVDWDSFKKKITSGSKEPIYQMALEFDTEVDRCIGDNLYTVTKTNPKCWAIDTKPVLKLLKGEGLKISPKFFETFLEKGVKIYAATDAHITLTYSHECLGNILQSAGVTRVS
jgi:hypothetical protein